MHLQHGKIQLWVKGFMVWKPVLNWRRQSLRRLKQPTKVVRWPRITRIPWWTSNDIHYKVWDDITYPFPNCTIEGWECACLSMLEFNLIHVSKMGPSSSVATALVGIRMPLADAYRYFCMEETWKILPGQMPNMNYLQCIQVHLYWCCLAVSRKTEINQCIYLATLDFICMNRPKMAVWNRWRTLLIGMMPGSDGAVWQYVISGISPIDCVSTKW